MEDVTTGPHGPDRPFIDVISRAREIDPRTGQMIPQGRWLSREAGERVAASVDTSKMIVGKAYSVPLRNDEGIVVRGFNTYPERNVPASELVMTESAQRAAVILKKNGQIHTFPIGSEHLAFKTEIK